MQKTVYVSDEDAALFDQAQKAGLGSLSSIIAKALRLWLVVPQCQPVPPWMTVEQCAGYLQITPEVVRQKARDGILPSSRVGQQFRFSVHAIDAWLMRGGDAQREEV